MPKPMSHDDLVRLARRGLIGKADKRAVAEAILSMNDRLQQAEEKEQAAKPKRKPKANGDVISDVGGE